MFSINIIQLLYIYVVYLNKESHNYWKSVLVSRQSIKQGIPLDGIGYINAVDSVQSITPPNSQFDIKSIILHQLWLSESSFDYTGLRNMESCSNIRENKKTEN